jgi:hypothetical protein
MCNRYLDSANYREIVRDKLKRTDSYITRLSGLANLVPGQWKNKLNIENFNPEIKQEASVYLDSLKRIFMSLSKEATAYKNSVSESLIKAIGNEGVVALRDNYENKKLIFMVLDQEPGEKIVDHGDKIIQKFNPGYMKATSNFGRAHFYAPIKRLGNLEIDTYWFNIIAIWVVTSALYIALYFNILQKLIKFLGSIRSTKSAS